MNHYSTLIGKYLIALFIGLQCFNDQVQAQALSGTKTIGATGGTYTSLTSAFAAASTNGIAGPVIFELLSNYSSASETFPITIGAISGSSSTNTITVRPQTGATGLSINSSNATTTIDLNGATNIIIDGRPGGSGTRNLVINNSSSTGLAIRFINDACFNTIRHTILSGQNTATTGGVIFFGGTTGSRGNDSNTVDNCDIKDDGGNTPTTSVYSSGSTTGSAYFNSNNFITNCNISNFWNNSASEVNAFKISAGSTDWVITGNSMYQTASRNPTAAFQLYFFNMNNASANNHIMNNNYMGGSAPQCGGSPFVVNATVGFRITGGYLNVGSSVPSSFSGNTIANFDITSGTTAYTGIPGVFSGPWLVGGLFNVNNNTFGNMNGTSSIKITNNVNGNAVFPIGATGTTGGTINIKGNNFGGIDVQGANPTISSSLQCISIATSGNSVYYNIDSNTIGNNIPENLTCSTPTTSSTIQIVMGIYNASAAANINARGNIIRNLKNGALGSASGISYYTHGIDIGGGGVDTISGNTIYNLINAASYQNNNSGSAAIIGLRLVVATSGNICAQNTVYNLYQTNSGANALSVLGILLNTETGILVDRNVVHSLSLASSNTSSTITGLLTGSGTYKAMNNMIRLGLDSAGSTITTTPIIYGLSTGGGLSAYHNSVYIGGGNVGTGIANTYAHYSTSSALDTIANNIFSNERSNASTGGIHYAVGYSTTSALYHNYNNYYTSGTGGVLGNYNATSYSTLTQWNTATGFDANGFNSAPGFKNATGTYKTVDLHILNSGNRGIALTSVKRDFDNDLRNSQPDLGADEIPNDAGVVTIDSPTTTTFCGQSKSIWVKIKNFGPFNLTSVWIMVNVNGNLATSFNWSGNLTPGATSGSINVGTVNFTGGPYTLGINTTLPNGRIDNNSVNDTTSIQFTATPTVVPNANISTINTTVCINSPVTFKANFSGGGTSPVFVWKKNSSVVGTNDTVYTSSTLANSDTISVTLTSNANCANPVSAISNKIIMTVGTTLIPSVTITNSTNFVCSGTPISFKATPLNGGTTPHYQWKKNNINVGTDSIAYLLSSPNNNDSIKCIMTSTLSCASKPSDTSAAIKLSINPTLVPTALVSATSTTICSGVSDTFTVSITNGGANPIYSWKKNNNIPVGTNSPTFITSALSAGDSIYVTLTSNALCANPTIINSNKIGIDVKPSVTPAATTSASKNIMCVGDSIKFTSNITNGGTSPLKQWYKNGTLLFTGIDSFTTSNLNNKDTVYMILTSNAVCYTQATATSNKQIITVNPLVTPSVTMNASATTLCSGTAVQFTALPVNPGTAPHYTWRKNGVVVGTDSSKFTTTFLADKDSIYVLMTSNAPCASRSTDSSAKVTLNVNTSVTPTVSINTNTQAFCSGNVVSFTSNFSNGGNTPHFQWLKNSTVIGGDSGTLTYLGFTNKDTVSMIFTSNATCATSNNIKSNKIILLMIPSVSSSVSVTESANSVCAGTSVNFIATPTNGGVTPTYQWKINGTNVGINNPTFTVDTLRNSDSVSVMMTSSATCASPLTSSSNKIGMIIKPLLIPDVIVNASSTTICSGEIVTFTATDVNGGTNPIHRWFRNNNPVGTDSIKYTGSVITGDVIKCVLTTNVSCAARPGDTTIASMIIHALPPKPSITRNQDTLISSLASNYQWALNNVDISGANNRKLIIPQNGTYKVTVDSLGCKNSSNDFAIVNLAVQESSLNSYINLVPNPTNHFIYLNAQFLSNEPTTLQVIDMTGRICATQILSSSQQILNHEIDLGNMQYGVYMIAIQHGEQSQYLKIIKAE